MARIGKIARLPLGIREELNQRLLNGEPGRTLLAWLNELAETKRVIAEMGTAGGHVVGLIDDKNLSDWRQGGFADWLTKRERIAETRELAKYAHDIAKASGGNLSEGAAAILSGKILEVLEGISELTAKNAESAENGEKKESVAESIGDLTLALSRLRKGDHNAEMVRLNREKLAQAERSLELEREKFKRTTCEIFLKWYEDKRAIDAANGAGSNADKIERLGQIMFGEDWGK